jgi:hypothetical protein
VASESNLNRTIPAVNRPIWLSLDGRAVAVPCTVKYHVRLCNKEDSGAAAGLPVPDQRGEEEDG